MEELRSEMITWIDKKDREWNSEIFQTKKLSKTSFIFGESSQSSPFEESVIITDILETLETISEP